MTVAHLLTVFQGDYSDTEDVPEIWQIGVRSSLVFGSTDAVGTFPDFGGITEEHVSETSGSWDIVSTLGDIASGIQVFTVRDWMKDYALPAAETFFATGTFATQLRLLTVKTSAIEGTTGHVYGGYTCLATSTSPVSGSTTGLLPLQCATVASFRTGRIGPKGRGRVYLPAQSPAAMDTHGRLTSSYVGDVANNVKTFLQDLSFHGAGLGTAEVRPCVTGKPYTNYATVTEVRVGDVVDTQRRRRRQLVEAYQSATPSYA